MIDMMQCMELYACIVHMQCSFAGLAARSYVKGIVPMDIIVY